MRQRVDAAVVAFDRAHLLARGHGPHLDLLVVATGSQLLAIGRKRQRIQRIGVAGELVRELAIVRTELIRDAAHARVALPRQLAPSALKTMAEALPAMPLSVRTLWRVALSINSTLP